MPGRFNRGFLRYRIWGPAFGGAYFRNFTVFSFLLPSSTVEPLRTDTSLIRTVHLVPGKCPYILCKNNLYNTDNGHEISAPKRKFIQTEPLYYGHSNDDTIQHDFLFVVTYQSVINCLIVHTITVSCFQSAKIILSTCHCHLSSRFLIL